jgi:hypothetical protein
MKIAMERRVSIHPKAESGKFEKASHFGHSANTDTWKHLLWREIGLLYRHKKKSR